jgi:hypothetical protein
VVLLLVSRGRKTTHQLAFSLTLDSVEMTSLDFVAPDEQVFDYWTDGINALLGNSYLIFYIDSELFVSDFSSRLKLEVICLFIVCIIHMRKLHCGRIGFHRGLYMKCNLDDFDYHCQGIETLH